MQRNIAEKLVIITFFSIVILSLISFIKTQTVYSATTHLVISEVQIAGAGGVDEDFIELYNPTDTAVDLNGYKLVKRTATGTSDSSIKAWSSETIIPSHSYYLWANSSWTPSTTPDTTTASKLAANNGVALRQGAMDEGAIIDSVAWGEATNAFVETSAFPTNPAAGESLERVGDDTNNNSVDYILQTNPNPQNLSSSPSPTGSLPLTPTGSISPTPTTNPAPTGNNVVINEIAWAGTVASADDEWIELYNTSDSSVDLTDWTLAATDGTPNITLVGEIPTKGYFLLERSNDDTVKDVAADQIYSGALANTGESLELRNSGGGLIDTANADGGGWPGGNSTDKKSMERINPILSDTDDNWATNDGLTVNGTDEADNAILGTPKNQNSSYQGDTPTPTPTGTISPTPTGTLSITPTQAPSATPTQKPTSTATPTPTAQSTPTAQPTLTPAPSPTPSSEGIVIAQFNMPNKTVTCTLTFKVKVHKFFIMFIPKINCR